MDMCMVNINHIDAKRKYRCDIFFHFRFIVYLFTKRRIHRWQRFVRVVGGATARYLLTYTFHQMMRALIMLGHAAAPVLCPHATARDTGTPRA